MDHEDFLDSHCNAFKGREEDLQALLDFALDDTEKDSILMLKGEVGEGKGALLSKFTAVAREKGLRVFYHSALASLDASDANVVLHRMMLEFGSDELKAEYEAALMRCDKREMVGLAKKLFDSLEEKGQRIVFVIVGLQSFEQSHFLPLRQSFRHLRFMTASENGAILIEQTFGDADKYEHKAQYFDLHSLHAGIKKSIVAEKIGKYNKRLDEVQMDKLISNPGSDNMVWLAIACEELRVYGVFETLTNFIENLPPSLTHILRQCFARQQQQDKDGKWTRALALITAATTGLYESEVRELFKDEHGEPMSALEWSSIYEGLRPFVRTMNGRLFLLNHLVNDMLVQALGDAKKEAHVALVPLSRDFEVNRQVLEYPHQLANAGFKKELLEFFFSPMGRVMNPIRKFNYLQNIRCRFMIPANAKCLPVHLCRGCADRIVPGANAMRKELCVICGSRCFSRVQTMGPNIKVDLSMGEGHPRRCQQHAMDLYMPNPISIKCIQCKFMFPVKNMFPALACRQCTTFAGNPNRCCYLNVE